MTQCILWVLSIILYENFFFVSDFKTVHRMDSRYSESNKHQNLGVIRGGTCVLQVAQNEVPGKSDLKMTSVSLLDDVMGA